MKRSLALLAGLALFAGADGALAHGGGRSGGFHGGGHSTVFHGGGHPVVGVRPAPIVRPAPVFIGRAPFFHRHRVVAGGTVVIAAPFFYSYYPYYYPPAYPAEAYSESPAYIEQGTSIQYYCPDYGDYYPNVASCPSPWMQVLPDGGAYPR